MRVRHVKRTYRDKSFSVLAKDGHVSGFCRDIQLLESSIECEDVWVLPDWVHGQYFHGFEIDQCKLVVFLTCDKGQPSRQIERNPVRTLDSGYWIASDNLGSGRVNCRDFVLFVNRNKDVAGARVIDSVARAAVERDRRDQRVGRCVDHATAFPCSSETKTPFGPGAKAIPSGYLTGPVLAMVFKVCISTTATLCSPVADA